MADDFRYNEPASSGTTRTLRAPEIGGKLYQGCTVHNGSGTNVFDTSLPVTATQGTAGTSPWLVSASGTVAISNTVPVSGTFWQNTQPVSLASLPALATGSNNIGDVDVLTVPSDPFGADADAASATGSISAKLRFIAATGIPVTGLPALAAGTNNIGDVDVLTLPALPAGSNTIGKVINAAGTAATYIMQSTFQAMAQNKLFFDLFNASGSGKVVRVRQITMQKNMATVTGVAVQFDLSLTTSVGTGGTTLTPVKLDSGNAAIPAQITARHAAAGGAALGSLLCSRFYHSEETNVAAQCQEAFPFWPLATLPDFISQDIVLREGEGVTLKQITNSTAGTYNAVVIFTLE